MKTDRELLELAAKAAGKKFQGWREDKPGACCMYVGEGESGAYDRWNPLEDDGDALWLAVTLGLSIHVQERCVYVETNPESLLGFSSVSDLEMHGNDPYAATRRAIVRAAAAIGEAMP